MQKKEEKNQSKIKFVHQPKEKENEWHVEERKRINRINHFDGFDFGPIVEWITQTSDNVDCCQWWFGCKSISWIEIFSLSLTSTHNSILVPFSFEL